MILGETEENQMVLHKKGSFFILFFFISFFIPFLLNAQSAVMNLDLSRYAWRVGVEDLDVLDYGHSEHTGKFPNGSWYAYGISWARDIWIWGRITLADGEEVREYRSKAQYTSTYLQELPFGSWEISKYPYPKVIVDGIESNPHPLTDKGPLRKIVDPTIKADKMFVSYRKMSPWMYVRYEMSQYVNTYYGDFNIQKYTYIISFDDDPFPETIPDLDADTTQTINKFYVVKAYRPGTQSVSGKMDIDPNGSWFVHHGGFWTSSWEVESIVPGCDRDKLVISYGWDGDHPNLVSFTSGGAAWDDTGEPRRVPFPDGNILSPAYSGFSLLHCDKSPSDPTDEVSQNPYTSRVQVDYLAFRGDDSAWPGSLSAWNYLIKPGPGFYEKSTLELGTNTNPTTLEGKLAVQVWGGWDLNMGDSVSVVHAVGAGSISRPEARALGWAWANWYQFGDVPEAYYDDPVLGNVLATDIIKNNIIARGKDSLKVSMQRAQELWENDLECPRPYPSPDLFITSGPYSVNLEWADVMTKYPAHEGGNVIAYRIYRKKGHFEDEYQHEAGQNIYWSMIKELPVAELQLSAGALYSYVDIGLVVGEDYHYAVTAVSDKRCGIDGSGPFLESSKWSNRSLIPAIPIIPGKSRLDSVVVVPNPYYIQGGLLNFISDNNQLMFANLPPYCTLYIYNITGDLIHTIEHTDGSSVDFWEQITQNNQYIASGVYILVVKEAQKLVEDEQGSLTIRENLSGDKFVKFTIIR